MANIPENTPCLIANVYLQYYDSVKRYMSYRLPQIYEAEDLAQDVFVRLLGYRNMLSPSTIHNLIFTITRNIVNDHLRAWYRKEIHHVSSYSMDLVSSNETEDTIICNDLQALEKKHLQTFPAQRKQVYTLSRIGERNIQEISEEMNISGKTVEHHLFLARKDMRLYLKECI